MKAIPGATNSSYKPEQTEGTTYYRVSVQLTGNGTTSDPYYSNTVPVTFTATKMHTHSFSSVWEHNDLSHWHQCTCGEHGDEAFHTYTWTILKAPTATEDGEQKGVCSVCGYETIQPIPAGSDTDAEDETPEKLRCRQDMDSDDLYRRHHRRAGRSGDRRGSHPRPQGASSEGRRGQQRR